MWEGDRSFEEVERAIAVVDVERAIALGGCEEGRSHLVERIGRSQCGGYGKGDRNLVERRGRSQLVDMVRGDRLFARWHDPLFQVL